MKPTNAELRAKLQRFEVEDRIAWLKDHIHRFEQAEDGAIRKALLHAWRSELLLNENFKARLLTGNS